MRIPFAFLSVLFLSAPLSAGQTPWQEVAPESRLRLIFSDVLTSDGMTMMALELDMPANSKTYWRVPGETGIPLQIDLAGSTGLGPHEIIWPFPERFQSYGFLDYVYSGSVIIPIQVRVDDASPRLNARLVLGVCADVCVPVSVEVSHDLSFERRDARAALLISQSMADIPIPWDGPGEPVGRVVFELERGLLHVQVDERAMDAQSIIPTIGDTPLVFSPPRRMPGGDVFSFELLGSAGKTDLTGQQVTIAFMSPEGPYQITRSLEIVD